MSGRSRSDRGFTLTELLLSVAILGVIAPVIGGAIVAVWRTTDSTVEHLEDTGNRQRVQAWFVRDGNSAATVDKDAASSSCLGAGETLVLRMTWSETVGGSSVTRVATYATTGTAPDLTLVRRACGNSSRSLTTQSTVSVGFGLTAAPTATCYASDGSTSATCASTQRMALTVTDASGSFTNTARRRSV